jgi:GNAT superfamily N-acetyltransferase
VFVPPGEPTEIDHTIGTAAIDVADGWMHVYRFEFNESDELMIWGSRVRYWLDLALPSDRAIESLEALLRCALAWVSGRSEDHPDRTLQIRWPARDFRGAELLGREGFRPLLHLARRRERPQMAEYQPELGGKVALAKPSDQVGVTDLIYNLHGLEVSLGTYRLPPFTYAYLDKAAARALREERILVWRSSRGEILGCLEFEFEPPGSWLGGSVVDGPVAMIKNVFVVPDARRGGVAKALLSAAIDRLRDRPVLLVGYSAANDGAQHFWQYAGFDRIWTTWCAVI